MQPSQSLIPTRRRARERGRGGKAAVILWQNALGIIRGEVPAPPEFQFLHPVDDSLIDGKYVSKVALYNLVLRRFFLLSGPSIAEIPRYTHTERERERSEKENIYFSPCQLPVT